MEGLNMNSDKSYTSYFCIHGGELLFLSRKVEVWGKTRNRCQQFTTFVRKKIVDLSPVEIFFYI